MPCTPSNSPKSKKSISDNERRTLMALLIALGVPERARCSASQCVDAILAVEQKLEKSVGSDLDRDAQSVPKP
jgi:hypothetical protein